MKKICLEFVLCEKRVWIKPKKNEIQIITWKHSTEKWLEHPFEMESSKEFYEKKIKKTQTWTCI